MRILVFSVITVVVLGGLWLALKPQALSTSEPETAVQQTPATASTTEASRFTLEINDGAVKGPAVYKVTEGHSVEIQITSDRADEAHLHGYDLHLDLKPGIAAHLRFTADRSGRFELELHDSHQTIGALEVYPTP